MFIIHAGMHKTGTTAIQHHLYHQTPKGVHYLPWRDPNHSDLGVVLVDEAPETYWVFRREGRSAEDMQKWRGETMGQLEGSFGYNRGKTHVMSAEWLSVAPIDAILRLKEFFARHADAFKIIIYVRPAEAYMASMAQQYIRTGTSELKLIWPVTGLSRRRGEI